MEHRLTHRVALVTGGSKGIGGAIAQRLAAEGATVAIAARDTKTAAALQKDIETAGGKALAVGMDVSDAASVERGVKTISDRFGRLDIVVANAGGAVKYGPFSDLTDADWHAAFNLNVMGMVHTVRASLPLLKVSPCARLICISSISGMQPGLFNPHYSAMKAATINLAKSLSKIHAADGIRVNTVCPGPVHSDAWDKNIENFATVSGKSLADATKAFEDAESAKVPLGRVGEGKDIAGVVALLASDEGDWITGSSFHINGGKLAAMG